MNNSSTRVFDAVVIPLRGKAKRPPLASDDIESRAARIQTALAKRFPNEVWINDLAHAWAELIPYPYQNLIRISRSLYDLLINPRSTADARCRAIEKEFHDQRMNARTRSFLNDVSECYPNLQARMHPNSDGIFRIKNTRYHFMNTSRNRGRPPNHKGEIARDALMMWLDVTREWPGRGAQGRFGSALQILFDHAPPDAVAYPAINNKFVDDIIAEFQEFIDDEDEISAAKFNPRNRRDADKRD